MVNPRKLTPNERKREALANATKALRSDEDNLYERYSYLSIDEIQGIHTAFMNVVYKLENEIRAIDRRIAKAKV